MKLTKYEQSGFVLTTDIGVRVAFDIGSGTSTETAASLNVDAHFITHLHPDHMSVDNASLLSCLTVCPPDAAESLAPKVAKLIPISPNTSFGLGDITITSVSVNHGPISRTIFNFGYVIRTNTRSIFFMGDMKVDSITPYTFDTVLIPIGGNKVFTPAEAASYLSRLGFAGTVIPIHTDLAAQDGATQEFIDLLGNGFRLLPISLAETIDL